MTKKYNVNIETDWRRLKTHVFEEFDTIEEAEEWTFENIDKIKAHAKSERKRMLIREPVKRRVNITSHVGEIGTDIASLYFIV